MQVYKAFLKIAKKRIPAICMYFIIFAIICLMMTFNADKSFSSNFETSSLNVCIIDESSSTASNALTSYLGSIHHLIDLPDGEEVLQDNLYYRYVDYILTIPSSFEEELLAGNTDHLVSNVKVPGSAKGTFIDQQVSAYLQTLQIYVACGYQLTDAIEATNTSISNASAVTTLSFDDNSSTGVDQYVFYFFRYLPYVLFSLLVSGLAPLLVIMNKQEIKERTLCSSLHLNARTGQIALGAATYSIIAWGVFLLLGIFCYKKTFFETNSLYALLNSFVFLLFCAAMTLFTSSFGPSGNVTNMISNVVGLGMSFLCGIFVPQSMLSENIVKASRFLPAYWYTRANDMLGGFSDAALDMNFYWQSIGIQLLFTLALFVAALVSNQVHRQKS